MNAFRDFRVAAAFILIIVAAGAASYLVSNADARPTLLPAGSQTAAVETIAEAQTQESLSLITEPEDGVSKILSAIENAHTSVDLVIYQLTDSDIIKALEDDAARGVHVRVILNSKAIFGKNANAGTFAELSSANVPVKWSSSTFVFTHQKTLVVDGTEAYVLTFNLTPKYYASSRDFGLVDADMRDVRAIEDTFDADWNGNAISARQGSDLVWSPGSAPALLALIDGAKTSLDIYNEEMADPRIISALENAAARGVHVRVVMTYATSWKTALNELTEKGITVKTFSSSAKLYIHAKMILEDGAAAFLGSENFSGTSMDDNRELGLLISNPSLISSLKSTFESDFTAARPYAYRK